MLSQSHQLTFKYYHIDLSHLRPFNRHFFEIWQSFSIEVGKYSTDVFLGHDWLEDAGLTVPLCSPTFPTVLKDIGILLYYFQDSNLLFRSPNGKTVR